MSETEGHPSAATSRRDFVKIALGAGAALGLVPTLTSQAAASAEPFAAGSVPFDLASLRLPFRQDDPGWGRDLMWDRKLVVRAATSLNRVSKVEANSLLREFPDGNTLANEGCLLTSMAMVLRMLASERAASWNPRTLNRAAQNGWYYTKSGVSMTTLVADLVSDVSLGSVQLGIKEEWLPGIDGRPARFCDTSALVRAYRSLAPPARADFLVMLKIGTWDDTVASHYVLLDPNSTDAPGVRDAEILDPAMPAGRTGSWRLSDSSTWILQDPEIAAAWEADGVAPMQLAGAWVWTRWDVAAGRSRMGPLVAAWADEISAA
jgi:hypothetical protein